MFELFQDIVNQSKKGFAGYDVTIESVWPRECDYPITAAFHWVGRNSSHYFAISTLKDGSIVYLSDSWDYKSNCFKHEAHICPVGQPPSYFGHW